MAATTARAQGITKHSTTQNQEVSRIGHGAAKASVPTWRTFVNVYIRADGAGDVEIRRDGKLIHAFEFDPEPESSA